MTLLDTGVLIRFARNPDDSHRSFLFNRECAISGVTLVELMQGARTPQELADIQEDLSVFPQYDPDSATWPLLGKNLYTLRKAGIRVPFQDALLATLAIQHGMDVWAYDAHFPLMQSVFWELQLFVPHL